MSLVRRLPSFTILLVVISVTLMIPLTMFGIVGYRDADLRYDTAISTQVRAERAKLLLELTPSLHQEQFSAEWESSAEIFLDGLPNIIGLNALSEFGATASEDQQRVDALVVKLGIAGLSEQLAATRSTSEMGVVELFGHGALYSPVIGDVEETLETEVRMLSNSASKAGAAEVVQAVRVAETTVELQIAASRLQSSWARVAAAKIVPISIGESIQFADDLAAFEQRIADFERVVQPASPVGTVWRIVDSGTQVRQLRERYRSLVKELAASGIDPSAAPSPQIIADTGNISGLIASTVDLRQGLEHAEALNRGLAAVGNASLTEVDSAAAAVVVDAESGRAQVLALTVVFFAQIAIAGVVLVLTVGRPIKKMAAVAHELSLGELDTTLDEVGPREIRMGARALNEAIASVRIAESQALALAEERLDDTVMFERAPGELGKSLQAAVTRLALSLADRDSFQRQLEHDAAHDHLTRLANRHAILDHLNAALARTRRSDQTIALLFLDVDDFKEINDTYGHHTGDVVLQSIAERLLATIRSGDLAGRLGGDEFVVIAEPVGSLDAALTLSHRIVEAVAQPVTIERVTFHPSVSVGVGMSDALSTLTADELLRDADSAVYRAKRHGKGRVEVCDENLRQSLIERDVLEQAIRAAVDSGELRLYFQPSVRARDRAIVGVEALVRWDRPGVGLVTPDAFIRAAERTDLILDIDRWVLDAAARQLASWSQTPTLRSVMISVNISGRHLGSGTLLRDVELSMGRHGAELSKLVLEVTETALLEDIDQAAQELAVLRERGVRVALDDFGTGFMSLSHLRQLPVDILKIDRSFVSQIESHADHSLVQLIVDTGHLLGATITGEGVETETQAQVLANMSVDHLQGFYFSPPIPADEILTFAAACRERSVRGVP